MQYKNANGDVFNVSITGGEAIAFLKGEFVAKASTESELEELLEHISHANTEITKHYLGLDKGKTAD